MSFTSSTVRELIRKLEKLENKDREIVMQGCDCDLKWNGTLQEFEDQVYLKSN